jgi:hypothetical protein
MDELLLVLLPLFTFLTLYEGDNEDTSTVLLNLKELYRYECEIFSKINDVNIKAIIIAMLNDLYIYTLHSNFGRFYAASYALSVKGGEELRKENKNFVQINPVQSCPILDYDDTKVANKVLDDDVQKENSVSEEIEAFFEETAEQQEEIEIESDSDTYNSEQLKESSLVKEAEKIEEYTPKTDENQLFVLFLLLRIYRKKLIASIDGIYEDICHINVKYSTIQLLRLLWKKLYPQQSEIVLNSVIQYFSSYWSKGDDSNPLGLSLIYCSNFQYWSTIATTLNNVSKCIAADFALRITCAGVTECSVERVFSHLRWILGLRSYKLKANTIKDLLYLKNL